MTDNTTNVTELLNNANQNEFESNEYIHKNIVNLDKSNVEELHLDIVEFNNGISKMSELCGMISALVNVGITPSMALSYISEKEVTEKVLSNGLETAKVNAEYEFKKLKSEYIDLQKQMI